MSASNRLRLLARRDDGRIAVFFAILAPAFIAMLGLIVDGGGQIRALQRADNIATEAARAGGQAINGPQAITGGRKEVDPTLAVETAQVYLAAAGAKGTVVINPDLQHITVTVRIPYDTVVLRSFGIDSWTVTATVTATLVVG